MLNIYRWHNICLNLRRLLWQAKIFRKNIICVKWYDNIVEYIDGIIFFAKEMMKFDECV